MPTATGNVIDAGKINHGGTVTINRTPHVYDVFIDGKDSGKDVTYGGSWSSEYTSGGTRYSTENVTNGTAIDSSKLLTSSMKIPALENKGADILLYSYNQISSLIVGGVPLVTGGWYKATADSTITLPSTEPTNKYGGTFEGWKIGGKTYKPGETVPVSVLKGLTSADITPVISYQVTIDGVNNGHPVTVYKGQKWSDVSGMSDIKNTGNVQYKIGSTVITANSVIGENPALSNNTNIDKQVKVTFQTPQYGSLSGASSVWAEYGSSTSVLTQTVSGLGGTGYIFDGWTINGSSIITGPGTCVATLTLLTNNADAENIQYLYLTLGGQRYEFIMHPNSVSGGYTDKVIGSTYQVSNGSNTVTYKRLDDAVATLIKGLGTNAIELRTFATWVYCFAAISNQGGFEATNIWGEQTGLLVYHTVAIPGYNSNTISYSEFINFMKNDCMGRLPVDYVTVSKPASNNPTLYQALNVYYRVVQ